MKLPGVLFMLLLAIYNAHSQPVFRYDDTETGQSHYMEGEPGMSVNGGWEFVAPEGGNYQMNYIANENGFQPQGDHIPVHVDDTEDVKSAKTQFYTIFDETNAKMEALNNKRVEREADDPNTVIKPAHYAPFYGYFPRHMIPKMKKSEEEVQKVQMEMKDIHEKYIKTRKEQLEKLANLSPNHYSQFYYYPQHLVPDMKLSEDELQKLQEDMKEADEKYMKAMKEQMDNLSEDFPYYPNFYPPITHFPVKDTNDVENKEEKVEQPMLPKFTPLHPYTRPYYYTYSYNKMKDDTNVNEEQMDKETHIVPKHLTYSPYFYGYRFPKFVKQEVIKEKSQTINVEKKENSRRKRNVEQPAAKMTYVTYPHLISQSYYPTSAVYYPRLIPSQSYHPTAAQVTRTVVKLPETLIDNSLEGGEDMDIVNPEKPVIGSDGVALGSDMEDEPEPEESAEPQGSVEPEKVPEPQAEPDVEPEKQPTASAVVASSGGKVTQLGTTIQRPIYYPSQGLLNPGVAITRPAFNPLWGTRLAFYPVYPTVKGGVYPGRAGYIKADETNVSTKSGQNLIPVPDVSKFPVKEKDLKLAAIVA